VRFIETFFKYAELLPKLEQWLCLHDGIPIKTYAGIVIATRMRAHVQARVSNTGKLRFAIAMPA
jgi:hypothetical protein